ncbi:hypothetical protein BGZ70_002604 [Mortierella alpina]|uniref:Beta-lactamase-related domain-containing protein n=1 Tax=Mortierella alpina TaxID=64518 RepID=A0A9P6IUD6_MORAP|nr:hypothetical protein BGZ70_002604 [Mortierella alpina]
MSIAVLYKGELIFAQGFGKRNEHGDPFDAMTLAQIGSITKSFTATAIGEMVAEGKLDWDKTPVNKYLPEFELDDFGMTSQLTFVDMLSHRTGIPNIDLAFYRSKESRLDIIKRMKNVKAPSKLGSKADYMNSMYAVAGEAAARVAGSSYEDIVREKVIRPLGLTHTGFSVKEMKSRSNNHAMPLFAETLKDAQKGVFITEPQDEVYATMAPGVDIYSNVLDLVKYGRVILKGGELDGQQVLNMASIQQTLTPQSIMEIPRRGPEFPPMLTYGLGWFQDSYKGHASYHHIGGVGGSSSSLVLFPDDDLVIAQLSNLLRTSLHNPIEYFIADQLFGLAKTQDWIMDRALKETQETYERLEKDLAGINRIPERVPNKPLTHPLQEYAGIYTHSVFGDMLVRLENSTKEKQEEHEKREEYLSFELFGISNRMEHHHYEVFVMKFHDVSFKKIALASFRTGADGSVDSLLLDLFGQFEFKKTGLR